MDRAERIGNRLPRFYRYWEKDSLIFTLLRTISKQLDEAEQKITDMLKAHWVDTAVEGELDELGILLGLNRLSGEDDLHYRARLKRAANEYKGGGTVSAILEAVKASVGTQSTEDVTIVENPSASTFAEFTVRAGDTWTLGSNSIKDAEPSLTLIVEEGGEVSNPQIINLDTEESITFEGKLKGGQKLVIQQNKAQLDEKDVSAAISPSKAPDLLRKASTWKYSETLERLIAVFDTAKFDEHTFALRVPAVNVRFDWIKFQPATFEVHIKSKVLRDSGLSTPYLENLINTMKAVGVNALIKVSG